MAVTETRCDVPAQELSASFQPEDAFLITLTLRDFPNREYWEEGRLVSVSDVRAGQTCIHDLRRNPAARLDKPHHVVFFYLPRGGLDAIADDADARRIGDLDYKPVAIDDATISDLGTAMLLRSVIPTEQASCSSTTSSWGSGYMSLTPMAECDR
jgi:AraC family transcriptional regulator